MVDITICIAIIVAIIIRLVLMRGKFTLPTFYRRGNEMSFNLGSISTIVVAIVAAFGLMQTNPELFANWYVAAITAYTAPQIVDGVLTSGARNFMEVKEDKDTAKEDENIVKEDSSYEEVA